jgi:hypothetical protein
MSRLPYAPPKSVVADVVPTAPWHWARTKWLYLALLSMLACVMFLAIGEVPGFNLLTIACGLALGALLLVIPIRQLFALRTSNAPWWWDAMLWGVIAVAVLGAAIQEHGLVVIGLVAFAVLVTGIALVTWFVELRHGVRVYSSARGVVFVGVDNTR